jgi:hypothetical protein
LSINELKQTLASLYKRKGKKSLNPKDLELLASMELRWFEPNDTRRLIEIAQRLGILLETEHGLEPNFDINSIQIPVGFRPSNKLIQNLEKNQESLFMQLVNLVCLETGLEQSQVIADINKKQAKLNDYLLLEGVAVLYAKEKNVDVDNFIPLLKEKILSEN